MAGSLLSVSETWKLKLSDSDDMRVQIFSPDFDVIHLELHAVDFGNGWVVALHEPPHADGQVKEDEDIKVGAHSLASHSRVGAQVVDIPRDRVLPVVSPQPHHLPQDASIYFFNVDFLQKTTHFSARNAGVGAGRMSVVRHLCRHRCRCHEKH